MLRRMIARLTGDPHRGSAMFARAVKVARTPHWYVEGGVPDTPEGRFSVLSTVAALIILRLEQFGAPGEMASVALTERFVEAMDAEVREMGVSDPAIGKQVRSLVGALSSRLSTWRGVAEGGDWTKAVVESLYRGSAPPDPALRHGKAETRQIWSRLQRADLEKIEEGDAP